MTSSARDAVAAASDRIAADGRPGIWIELVDRDVALAAAAEVDARVRAGEHLPLAGRTLAVKDNIDVRGLPTTAGCPAYAFRPELDAPAVAALIQAGAVVVGKTNLDQFATGLVGTRSPYGICPNAHWPGLISGGSSAGSAVAVAAGLVDLALGTDTAGSGRVPAAANGIVGLKPTAGRISTAGVVPACASVDCVSVFATTVEDANLATDLAAGGPVGAVDRDAARVRIGIPRSANLTFDGDPLAADRFSLGVGAFLDAVGAVDAVDVVEVDIDPFLAAGRLLYGGAFVAERYAAVGAFVDAHRDEIDPVVGSIIAAARDVAGWEVYRDLAELRRLALATAPVWAAVDVLVVPSVPRVPTVAEVAADPFGVNAMLGTYTNFVNLLDLAALTVPIGAPGTDAPPASLTIIGPGRSDPRLVRLGAQVATSPAAAR
ncbi:MAG: putative allophanate hydrolase [Acidimicrobiales bacterium]|nr:putative allophanate hydrolase [Acidimicrobiales bacterium]